ncbi:hypothetical protein Q1695_012352 [Nippostrongylus brasiliensis]|nr:hypothetical protein Q1695_012352 [Nippostrongylus brasiliensis]
MQPKGYGQGLVHRQLLASYNLDRLQYELSTVDRNPTHMDHFKYIEKSAELDQANVAQPALDLAFKEGQTISIKIGKKGPDGQPAPARPRPQPHSAGGDVPLLPPPPGGSTARIRGPPAKPAAGDVGTSNLLNF